MIKTISKLSLTAAVLAVSTSPVMAQSFSTWFRFRPPVRPTAPPVVQPVQSVRSVPEIDASAGLLAIAAVLVILAFVWERQRRAAV